MESALLAAGLAAEGVGPGDRVVLSCEPSVATVAVYVAVLRLGAVVVPANTAYTRRELAHIVGDVRPALAVASSPERFAGLVAACDPVDLRRRGALVDMAPPLADDVLRATDEPAMVAYTSGTTGAPKGAVLSHANLLASACAVVEAWRWTADDTLVLALPLFHMHGLGVGVNGTLVAGGRAVVLPRFDVDAVLDAVASHEATMFFGVPDDVRAPRRAPAAARARGAAAVRLGLGAARPDVVAAHP